MSRLLLDISVSLDGYVAGPDLSMADPLGRGGEQLHEWIINTAAWRAPHGHEGGEHNADDDVVIEHLGRIGATIMGRRMFSGGAGPWADDGNANGWWGDEPPFHHPVYVLTHHEREPLALGDTTFTFVTEGGIEAAVAQARAAAGARDAVIAGGADVAQQGLRAGLVDELQLHVAPVFLGGGRRLLEDVPPGRLERLRTVESPAGVVHTRYAVAR
jgi:dihydrofolate reductase